MVTMQEWEQIRRAYHIEGKTISEIMAETGRTYRTVVRQIDSDSPPTYERKQPYKARKLGAYKERIKELLGENKRLPRKQRWTAKRICEQITEEGYTGAESTVRHYVGQVRKLTKKPKLYLPLEFEPGQDAQVDWGEADVIYQGKQRTVQVFYMTLCYSRRTFMMAFPSQKQEAFFVGHQAAFNFFGGVPQRISYDNLKTAVYEVLKGKQRIEQKAFLHFRGHYLFESHYCTPGAGNEKGIVEGWVGYGRRNFMVPLPVVDSFEELNAHLLASCLAEDSRTVTGQPRPIGEMWQEEVCKLRPLPTRPFESCRRVDVTVNKYSQVVLETNRYSVPCDKALPQVVAKLSPLTVKIYRPDEADPIAVHPRSYDKEQEIIDPLHYLPLLVQRPGAFEHAKPLRQWRAGWPPIYEQLLTHLRDKWPDGRGMREFMHVLYLHRDHTAQAISEAIEWALAHNCAHADGVRLWLTQLTLPDPNHVTLDLRDHPRLQQVGQQKVDATRYNQLTGGVA